MNRNFKFMTKKLTVVKTITWLAIAAAIYSCKKSEENQDQNVIPIIEQETFANLDAFFDSRATQPQEMQLDAAAGGSVTGAKGTVFSFQPNSFVHQNGTPVSGIVNVFLQEVFSSSDMIFNNTFPVAYVSYLLNSGGQYNVYVMQDNEELLLVDGQTYNVSLPAQAIDNNMELFVGVENTEEVGIGRVDWQPVFVVEEQDSLGVNGTFTFNSVDSIYDIEIDSLCWSNIDGFMNSITYFNMEFELTGIEGLDESNTKAYAIFDNENAVWPTGYPSFGSISNNVIYETHLGSVPLHLVVISVVDGQLYSGLLAVTPEMGINYTISMTSTTSDELDALISSCP
jgi:hypothetical protein